MVDHALKFAMFAFLLAAPAYAEDRVVGVGSFSRIRVEGGFDVRVATGSPRARISGDRSAVEAIDLHVDGPTLIVRRSANTTWEARPVASNSAPVVIALSASGLESATVIGGARVAIARMAGRRIDLAVTGTGAIALASARADQLNVQVAGSGSVSVTGSAGNARLTTNGPGTIDAGALDAGDLVVKLDGLGTTTARARYTATVDNAGLGTVTIAGGPKCTVRAAAGGPVTCGRSR